MEYRRQEPNHSPGVSRAEASPAAPGVGSPSFLSRSSRDVRVEVVPGRPERAEGRFLPSSPGGGFESPRPRPDRPTGSYQVDRA